MNTSTHSGAKPDVGRWAIAVGVAAFGLASLAAAAFAQSADAQTTSGQVTGTVTTATSTGNNGGGNGGTSTTTDQQIAALQAKIDLFEMKIAQLEAELDQLRAELDAIDGNGTTTNPGGNGTTTPGTGTGTTSPGVTMYPQSATVRAGTSIDFNGRGFWPDEQIYVMENGIIVATARADGGGNWSTGSLPVGTATGSYAVKFVGASSNLVGWSTVTVVP